MSRIGRLPVRLPPGVTVQLDDGSVVVKGPKGTDRHGLPAKIRVEIGDGMVRVVRDGDERQTRSLHGLMRKMIANSVVGLSQGFSRSLEIIGVGYRAEVKGNAIHLTLGYSHPIVYQLPPGMQAKVDRQTILTLEGNNRQLLGEVAAQIRGLRPPEPYKGKGIKYADEHIRRKAGKAAATAGK